MGLGGGLCCGIRSVGWQQRLSELVLGFWLLRGGRMGREGGVSVRFMKQKAASNLNASVVWSKMEYSLNSHLSLQC